MKANKTLIDGIKTESCTGYHVSKKGIYTRKNASNWIAKHKQSKLSKNFAKLRKDATDARHTREIQHCIDLEITVNVGKNETVNLSKHKADKRRNFATDRKNRLLVKQNRELKALINI